MSIFDVRNIEDIHEEIRQTYRQYPKPWVIGYSGGKDSTAVLQLIWNALKGLKASERKTPVYVIASDTLVETPVIVDYITTTLANINRAAQEQGMPFQAETVRPTLDESFWVNLLGRGYPAPTIKFRWCTERMKINPANRFIQEKVGEYGEVIMVLGTRSAESSTRAQLMNTYKVAEHSHLRYHRYLNGAYVYAPVADFTTDDIWTYLFQTPSPWGNNNRDLAAIYRNANAQGECPLVIDDSTPSCGSSRFGCWVCTVVEKDVSMGHLIRNGENWLEPLYLFRNHLADTRNSDEYRSRRGRDGTVRRKNGQAMMGSYNLKAVKEYLRMLLEAQKAVQEDQPDTELISTEELFEIRRLWRTEGLGGVVDWDDSVPEIFHAVCGHDLRWPKDDDGSFDAEQRTIMEQACEDAGVAFDLIARLLEAERRSHGMARRAGIHRANASELRKYLRSTEKDSSTDLNEHPASPINSIAA